MARLTPKQQHERNAAQILGKKWDAPEQENQHTAQAAAINARKDPEEKENRSVIQDLSKLNKVSLQEICNQKELSFEDSDTKATLIKMIEANQE